MVAEDVRGGAYRPGPHCSGLRREGLLDRQPPISTRHRRLVADAIVWGAAAVKIRQIGGANGVAPTSRPNSVLLGQHDGQHALAYRQRAGPPGSSSQRMESAFCGACYP